MFPRRAWTIVAAVLAAECAPGQPLDAPASATDARLLAVIEPSGEVPLVEAIAEGAALPAVTVEADSRLVLLELEGGLALRGLSPGPVPLVASGTGRPLPDARAVFALTAPASTWRPLDARPTPLDAVEIPLLDDCAGPGACRRFFGERLICDRPCPEPTAPAEPRPPAPPRPPASSCPDGWSSSEDGVCAPPARQSCPDAERQGLDDPACRPLRGCPPPGAFPPDAALPPDARFVDAAAAPGGDGSRDRPFPSLALALAPDRAIALAAGRYAARGPLPDGAHLIGACPRDVRVDGALEVAAGSSARVEGLTVVAAADAAIVGGALEVREAVFRAGRDGLSIQPGGVLDLARARVDAARFGLRAASGAPAAEVTLRALTVLGTRGHAVLLEGATRAELVDLDLRPTRGPALELRGDARASARGVWIEHDGGGPALRLGDDASLDADALHLRASELAFELSDRSALMWRASSAEAGRGLLLVADAASAALEDVGATLEEARGVALTSAGAGRLTVRRAAIRGGPSALLARARPDLVLEDVRARGFREALLARGEGPVTLTRVDLEGALRVGPADREDLYASYVGGPEPCIDRGSGDALSEIALTLVDGRVDGGAARSVLALCPGTVATATRVEITGGRVGVFAECRERCSGPGRVAAAALTDVAIDGPGQTGVLQRGGRLELARVRVGAGRSTYGVYVWGAQAQATDLHVERVGAERPPADPDTTCIENRSMRLRAPSSSVFVESWSSAQALERADIEMERFRLVAAACSGIAMGVDGSFVAREGRIASSHWGLGFIRFSEPVVGPRVVFEDNAVDVFRISGGP